MLGVFGNVIKELYMLCYVICLAFIVFKELIDRSRSIMFERRLLYIFGIYKQICLISDNITSILLFIYCAVVIQPCRLHNCYSRIH